MSLALLHSADNQYVSSTVSRVSIQLVSPRRHFVVGNAQGEMAQFDIKRLSSGSIVHKYNGVIGSIRSIDTHPTLPLIASASIDQYVRIHHAETYQQVAKVSSVALHRPALIVLFQFYLKSRLTSVLFSPHEILNHEEQKKIVATVTEELENDAVWSQFKRKSTPTATEEETYVLRSPSQRNHRILISILDLPPKWTQRRREERRRRRLFWLNKINLKSIRSRCGMSCVRVMHCFVVVLLLLWR